MRAGSFDKKGINVMELFLILSLVSHVFGPQLKKDINVLWSMDPFSCPDFGKM